MAVDLEELIGRVEDSDISTIKRIVTGVLSIINDPQSTVKELKELIEVDPPLTARVLKTANSAYYSSGRRIGEIEQAVIWIGYAELKEIVLRQKVCELFQRKERIGLYSRPDLWIHSVAVAIMAKMICRREFGERGENLYAAGILHDLGLIIEDQFLHEQFVEIVQYAGDKGISLLESEYRTLGFDHADIAGALAEEWNLPGDFVTSMGAHHDSFDAPESYARMDIILFIANLLAQRIGYGYGGLKVDAEKSYDRCMEALGLNGEALELIVNELKVEIDRMKDRELV
jgi:putative nucleotidyltransferase with HDIG domain